MKKSEIDMFRTLIRHYSEKGQIGISFRLWKLMCIRMTKNEVARLYYKIQAREYEMELRLDIEMAEEALQPIQ